MIMALKLGTPCEHCGDELMVYLRRAFPNGNLQAAVSHAFAGHHISDYKWKDIKGFDDLARLPSGAKGI